MSDNDTPMDMETIAGLTAAMLSESDIALARVVEDLIDVLISRGVIQFTDLPQAAQEKLLSRRQTRAKLQGHLDLLPDDSDGGLI